MMCGRVRVPDGRSASAFSRVGLGVLLPRHGGFLVVCGSTQEGSFADRASESGDCARGSGILGMSTDSLPSEDDADLDL